MAQSSIASPAPQVPVFRIVVGSDFSELGDRAILEGLRLTALHPRAELHVITVAAESQGALLLPGQQGFRPREQAQELARAHVADLSNGYFAARPSGALEKIAVYVAVGSPAERIVALATAIDADLVIVGTHGRQGMQRILLGSVADEVMRRAPCGVYVLRPRDFLHGEKVPEIQPPLRPGEHPLQPFRESVTYHYVDRLTEGTTAPRIMPAI